MNILSNILYFFLKRICTNIYKTQSFTYYVPAPPLRKTGYREKEFDKVFYHLINQGFEILEFTTVCQTQDNQSGFWLCFILRAKNKKASKLNLDNFDNSIEEDTTNNNSSMEIDYGPDFSLETTKNNKHLDI